MVFFTEWIVEICLNQTKAKKKEIKKARRKIKPENTGVLNKDNERNRSKSKKPIKGGMIESGNKNHEIDMRKEEVTALNPESILKSFQKLVNLELKYLFRNKIVEEDFMNALIKICFDLLELSNENKDNKNNTSTTKEMIFEILQHLITKYQSNVNVQIILIKLTLLFINNVLLKWIWKFCIRINSLMAIRKIPQCKNVPNWSKFEIPSEIKL
jgi:hypothetical protein